ncbi:glycosyltransferase [Streptomyces sp. NPDC047081]|uniref:glycosyltransferase family 8 protein n=1 Tax=Streptomyces sp. NPDC047081 TaxID=3154706 RepID=UPI0033C46D87
MIAYGFCIDERYVLPALVTIGSLAETLRPVERRQAAIRVLTLDLTRQHAATLGEVVRRAGFGSFRLRWAAPPRGAVMADTDYISVTAYLRFAFTPEFVERPYLIYLDADTLVVDNLAAPFNRLREGQLGLVPDEFNPCIGYRGQALPGLADDRPELRGLPYFNAGMWWTTPSALHTIREGVCSALRTGKRYIFHNDQDALNLWAASTAGVVTAVDAPYNRFELARFLECSDWPRRYTSRAAYPTDTAVLHFVGSAKPWLPGCPPTDDVRLYRTALDRTLRMVDRLGDHSISAPRFRGPHE